MEVGVFVIGKELLWSALFQCFKGSTAQKHIQRLKWTFEKAVKAILV